MRATQKALFLWGCLILLLFAVAEGFSYLVLQEFSKSGIVYDRKTIDRSYQDYLERRDATLGWLPGERDSLGARPDPSLPPDSSACLEAYGDSFTWGDEVGHAEAWGSLLSARLGCRILNFGVNGYGTDQSLIRYLESENRPPITLLNHTSADIVRNVNQFRNLIYKLDSVVLKPRFILEDDDLRRVGLPEFSSEEASGFLASPEEYLQHEYFAPGGPSGLKKGPSFPFSVNLLGSLAHYRIRSSLSGEPSYSRFYDPEHDSGALRLTERILLKFQETALQRDQLPVVTIIPTCADFAFFEENGAFPYGTLSSFAQDNLEHFIDLGGEILGRGLRYQDLFFSCRSHFNAEGNALLAQILEERLRAWDLLP